MIRFHQTFGAHTGRVLSFDQDVVRFGRMPDCDVIFDAHADIDASGRHAEVRRESGQYHVVDSGSRNGTWLNGQRVQQAVLSSGDELEFGLGGPRVKVEIPAHEAGVKTPSARNDTGPMTPAPPVSRPGASTEPATPVPPVASRSAVDGNAPTVAAMATPVPGVGAVYTPHPPSGYTPHPPSAPPPSSSPWAAPTPSSGDPASSSSPKLYGERTVGMMIQNALAQAGGRPPDSSAEFIQKVAAETAKKSSRGLRVAVALLGLLLVATLGVLGVVAYLMISGRGIGGGDPAAEIATRHAGAVYLLVGQRDGRETATCSAFAVGPDLLATSATCVVTVEEQKMLGTTFVAVGNRGQLRLPIARMYHHPEFVRGSPHPTADVGLVDVVGALPSHAELAPMADLVSLAAGDAIFMLGFPAAVADTAAPAATVTPGVVARVTGFDGSDAPPESAHLVSHDVAVGPATSGSPIFDAQGRVVAVASATGAAIRSDVLASLVAGRRGAQ